MTACLTALRDHAVDTRFDGDFHARRQNLRAVDFRIEDAQAQPEEMLIDEVEAIWGAIDQTDDWTPFQAKLSRLESARQAWAFEA